MRLTWKTTNLNMENEGLALSDILRVLIVIRMATLPHHKIVDSTSSLRVMEGRGCVVLTWEPCTYGRSCGHFIHRRLNNVNK